MEYKITNEYLQVVISNTGAEMQSVKKDEVEYLWNGDETYWGEQAPLLFPCVGRLTDGKYMLNGREYRMDIHGFARKMPFEVLRKEENRITLELRDNEDTYSQYPYHFSLSVTYELSGNQIRITYQVTNSSDERMYFGIGGHPGFKIPLNKELDFTDYYLEFSDRCRPERVGHTQTCFLSGEDKEFQLLEGKRIPLTHAMFDEDAIVLRDMADEVTLKSDKDSRRITVSYPDLSFLGIWHKPKSDAPYVCIEPWTSLPSRQGIVEELRYKSDLIRLNQGECYRNSWCITID